VVALVMAAPAPRIGGSLRRMVLSVEYNVAPNSALANQWHTNSSRRDLDLVGPTAAGYLYQPCVPDDRDSW